MWCIAVMGPLMVGGRGGVPASPVDFKKWQCRMSLSHIYAHAEFQNWQSRLSQSFSTLCCMSLSLLSAVEGPCRIAVHQN